MGDPAGHQEPAGVLQRRRRDRLSRSFLILHGLEGSGPDHWQTWLAGRLRERGEDVRYPDLPEPFDPDLETWLAALRSEIASTGNDRIVLCHSLACLLWMHYARECRDRVAERVLLVAPPCDRAIPAVDRFWPGDPDADALERAAGETLMLWSDEDWSCAEGAMRAFGARIPRAIYIENGGHLNTDAGYGPWPEVEEWALSGREPS